MGRGLTPAERFECVEPRCATQAVGESPVPLCGKHLRQTYEFAQGLVSEMWGESVAVEASRVAAARRPRSAVAVPATEVPGWVYFVRIGEHIKIGYSAYPAARFKTLRPDEVLALMPGTMIDERRCHAAFKHLLAQGREYFNPAPDLLSFIAGITAAA